MSKINHYFKTYTQSNECFETSDGFLFHQKTDATAHAASLADKNVETHKRLKTELREIVKEASEKALGKIAEKNSGKGKGKKNAETSPADSGAAETATAENADTSENPPADNSGAAE